MSLYLLDTDTFTLIQRGHLVVATAVDTRRFTHTVATTTITVEEVISGWLSQLRQAKSPAVEAAASFALAEATMHLSTFRVVPMTEPAIDSFGQLVRLKLNVGRMDLRIAAIALTAGATVVTHNLRDFRRVPGLAVEDWTVPPLPVLPTPVPNQP